MKNSERLLLSSLGALIVVFFSFQVGSIYKLEKQHEKSVDQVLSEGSSFDYSASNSSSLKMVSSEGSMASYLLDEEPRFADVEDPIETVSLEVEPAIIEAVNVPVLDKTFDIPSVQKGIITELHKSGFAWNVNGTLQEFKPLNARKGISANNSLTYMNVYPNTHIRYTQDGEHRKMDVVITDPSTFTEKPSDAESFVFVEHIKLPLGWKATLVDGEVLINNTDKEFVMKYPIPRAVDVAGNQLEGTYELKNTVEGFVLEMALDLEWLESAARTYPVKVDPSFQMMN